jgi:predicted cobalt transporter CbtA
MNSCTMDATCSASPATKGVIGVSRIEAVEAAHVNTAAASQQEIIMVGILLTRGMLVGFVAGLLCFGFLKLVGEPQVDRAIAFESAADAKEKPGAGHSGHDHSTHDHSQANGSKSEETMAAEHTMHQGMVLSMEEPELVSRSTQAGLGLFTGVTVYNTAFGGLFALVFAFAYRRMGDFDARTTSALLAISGIIAVYFVPVLKYPANPPAVGNPDTIGMRTAFYFTMIAISLAAMIAAWMLRNRLVQRYGGWNAALIAAAAYFIVVIGVALALPEVSEVPDEFPAAVLWQFRIASAGAQIIMWATIGLAFGALTERAEASRNFLRLKTAGR